jgi:hypothetical protein
MAIAADRRAHLHSRQVYPLETIKTRLSLVSSRAYSGMWDCFTSVLSREGVRGLYQGAATSAFGIVPYAGIGRGRLFSFEANWTFLSLWQTGRLRSAVYQAWYHSDWT